MANKKRSSDIQKSGYVDLGTAAELLNLRRGLIATYCLKGKLQGCTKEVSGKQEYWMIPETEVQQHVITRKKVILECISASELSNKLKVHRSTTLALLKNNDIAWVSLLGDEEIYIKKDTPLITKLIDQREAIDCGLYLTREELAAQVNVKPHLISSYEQRIDTVEKFYFFGKYYIRKDAIDKIIELKNYPEGYVDLKEASRRLNLSTDSISSQCLNGSIPNCLQLEFPRGMWLVPECYITEQINKRNVLNEYISLNDFSQRIGVSWKVIHTRIKDKRISDFKMIDNVWYIKKTDIAKYEEDLEWLRRKTPPPVRGAAYYTKNSIVEETANKITEIAVTKLVEITKLYFLYCKDMLGKTSVKGYRLKTYSTDLINVYKKYISQLPRDLPLDISEDVHSVIQRNTAISSRLTYRFLHFIKFAYGQLDISQSHQFSVVRKSRNVDVDDNEPYSPETYQMINVFARRLEEHVQRSLRSSIYANMWVYVLMHLTDCWRHQDIVEKLPNVSLETIGITNQAWFKENRMSSEQCQTVINELYLKLRPAVANKTRSYLTFLVEPSLVECVANAVVISEIHRRMKGKEKLLSTFINRTGEIINPAVGDHIDIFFRAQPELKVFRNQKMNRSTMTYFFYYVIEENKDDADVVIDMNKIIRSHEDKNSSAIYIKLMNKDGSINRISENLFKRGHFGWVYNYLIAIALEGRGSVQTLEDRTRSIQTFKGDTSLLQMEEWAKFINNYLLRQNDLIRDISKLPKEMIIDLIRKIYTGKMPSKTPPGQCLSYPMCNQPSRKSCFGCNYFIPQFYILIEAANEFRRVISSMQKAKFEATFIRDRVFLSNLLLILQEASVFFGNERVNAFLPSLERKQAIESLRAVSLME